MKNEICILLSFGTILNHVKNVYPDRKTELVLKTIRWVRVHCEFIKQISASVARLQTILPAAALRSQIFFNKVRRKNSSFSKKPSSSEKLQLCRYVLGDWCAPRIKKRKKKEPK